MADWPRLPETAMPFTRGYRGQSWNSQALFATDIGKQQAKQKYAWDRLLPDCDFLGLLETHGTKGKAIAERAPATCLPFWAYGTSQQNGVGLLVQNTLLAKFNPVDESSWRVVVPGRVRQLRLRGENGGLDLYVIYIPTGSEAKTQRTEIVETIISQLAPRERVLSLLFGDFNFVEPSQDRWNKERGCW